MNSYKHADSECVPTRCLKLLIFVNVAVFRFIIATADIFRLFMPFTYKYLLWVMRNFLSSVFWVDYINLHHW